MRTRSEGAITHIECYLVRSSNWLGHLPFTEKLTGSIPVRTTILRGGLEMVPARSHKPNHMGSIPIPATKVVFRRK